MRRYHIWAVLMLCACPSFAQGTTTPAVVQTLAERAARRFPQPVRVGDLIGRDVLEPIEAQPVIGHVTSVVRRSDGGLEMVVALGGAISFGARPVAVPIEAMALLGEFVACVGLTPDQLDALPTYEDASNPVLPQNDMIRVGVVRPFH